MHLLELLEHRADAQRPVHLCRGHVGAYLLDALVELWKTQVAVGVDVHAGRPRTQAPRLWPRTQMVCVGFDEEIDVPRISSIFTFSTRVFSSVGNRTPTPCVRPPDAFAGVTQPTLPATG